MRLAAPQENKIYLEILAMKTLITILAQDNLSQTENEHFFMNTYTVAIELVGKGTPLAKEKTNSYLKHYLGP